MDVSLNYPHIDATPGKAPCLGRLPRIRVAQVAMDYLAHGWSAEEMCRQHPALTPAEVHAAMAYYFDHQAEIDREIREEQAQLAQDSQGRPKSDLLARMRAMGRL
jgi:uncharacterized protein (DUF433 family)